jgi:protocatechuate 3,4-dioxygenase beta subunit
MLALSLVIAIPSLELQTNGAAAQAPQVTISGRIVDRNGRPMSDVVVFVEGSRRASALTSADGTYAVLLPAGGSYTVTPRRSAVVFRPATLSFSNVTTDQTNASFTGTDVRTFKVSGTVVDSTGGGVVDVVVRLGDSPQLLTLTSPSGAYSIDVAAGESYTVSPSKAGSTFDPPAFAIANANRNYSGINFVEVPHDKVRIGGTIFDDMGQPLQDVVVGLGGAAQIITSTGSSGSYGFTVASGQNYSVAPARNGYTFNPPILTFSALTENQGSANFVGIRVPTFSISGAVVDNNGNPMLDATVLITGTASGAIPTNGLGGYDFAGLVPGSYTVTPVREGFFFIPPSRILANILSDQNNVNFVGISGIPANEVSPGNNPATPTAANPVPSPSPNEATPTPTPTPTPLPSPTASPTVRPVRSPGNKPAANAPAESTPSLSPKTATAQNPATTSAKKRRLKLRRRRPTRRARRVGTGKRSSKGSVKRVSSKSRNRRRP